MAWREITVDYTYDPLPKIIVSVNPRINIGHHATMFSIYFDEYNLYKEMEEVAEKNPTHAMARNFLTRSRQGKLQIHRKLRFLEIRHGARVRRAMKECFQAIAAAPSGIRVVLQFLGRNNVVDT